MVRKGVKRKRYQSRYCHISFPEPRLIGVLLCSLVVPVEKMSQVAARAHVQSLGNPAQRYCRLGPQLGGQAHFELAAFALGLEFLMGPALPL